MSPCSSQEGEQSSAESTQAGGGGDDAQEVFSTGVRHSTLPYAVFPEGRKRTCGDGLRQDRPMSPRSV